MNQASHSKLDEKVLVKTASNNFANKSMRKFNLYSKPVRNNKSTFQIELNINKQQSSLSSSIDYKNSQDSKRNTRYSSVDRYTPTQKNYKDEQSINRENQLSPLSSRRPQPISILDQLQNIPLNNNNSNRSHQITTPMKITPRSQMIICNQCKETMPRELFFKHYDRECKGFRGYSNYTPQNVRESLKDILADTSLNKLEKPLDLLELKQQKMIKSIDKRRNSASYHQENTISLEEGKVIYQGQENKKCCPFCNVFKKIENFEDHINEYNLKQGYIENNESSYQRKNRSRPPSQSNENMRYTSKPSSPSSKEGEDYSQVQNQFKQLRQAKNLVKSRVQKNSKMDQQKQFNKVYDNYQDIIQKRISDISQLKKERDELRENVISIYSFTFK